MSDRTLVFSSHAVRRVGEYYLSQSTAAAVFDRSLRTNDRNAEVEILRFAT